MPRRLALISIAVTVLTSGGAAFGHHSAAPFDTTREVTFEGTVTELEWKNPHILLTLETRGANGGNPVLQEIEASALSQVRTWGLPREAIAPGERVVVRAWPNRSDSPATALGIDVTTRDGRVYPLNLQAAGALRPSVAAPAAGLAGRWVGTVEGWNRALSWAGSDFPYTEAGRAARAELVRALSNSARAAEICAPRPALPVMLLPELRTIEVSEESIVISLEAEGVQQRRIVHMDRAEHPAGLAPSLLGHSIGRWEGEALVIDTVGIAPHRIGSFAVASTATTHLVERLRLTPDRRQLEYMFTVVDPAHFTQSVSYTAMWDHRPDLEPSSAEPCDPDNARRSLVE